MDVGDVKDILDQGIAAAKRGEREQAEELLLLVLAEDEENESAWLWLSSVVESEADSVLCLRHVLQLNPESEPAKRGLERLGKSSSTDIVPKSPSMRDIKPVSPAASILYPERLERRWEWEDKFPLQVVDAAGMKSRSDFDDVWERESDICAFCAQEVKPADKKCPKCQRNLSNRVIRYPKSSKDLIIYWVLLLGIAQFFLLQAIVELIVGDSFVAVVWHGLLFVIIILLIVGLVLRQIWAYPSSIVFLLILFTAMFLGFLAGKQPDEVIAAAFGDDLVSFLTADLNYAFLQSLLDVIDIFQFAAVVLALFYGILKVGPDFERVRSRYTASVDRGLSDSSSFYLRGQEYAARDMWASAILHWRRAAANDPSRAYYQRALGGAYRRLGFYDRSIDVLESALDRTVDAASRTQLKQLIKTAEHEKAQLKLTNDSR
jgi:hypothetical protein